MKRKLFSIILSLSLIMSLTPAIAFAESQQNDIQSIEQLKAALSKDITEAEQAQIVEQTDETIVNELLMEKLDEAVTVLGNQENYAHMKTLPDGSSYEVQTYDLGDGCILTVELKDAAEGALVNMPAISPMASTTQPDQWKEYGNRYFTARASVTISSVTASMSLVHRYELSADGIEAKKGEADAIWNKAGGHHTNTTPSISDRYAKTVGASDVNIECVYSFNAGTTTAKYNLNTAVGYVDINKTAKKIKVRHSWNLTKI